VEAVGMYGMSDKASRENAGEVFAVRLSILGGDDDDDTSGEKSLCDICRYTMYSETRLRRPRLRKFPT
jgi:hypothetical protein